MEYKEYRWYKNGRIYVMSRDIERDVVFGVTKEYFDDHIGNKTYYEDFLDLKNSNIASLGKLEYINLGLILIKTNVTSLGNLEYVGGDLYLRGNNITSLGNIRAVDGDLDVYDGVTDLGKLETVGGNIYCDYDSPTYRLFAYSKFKRQLHS